MYGAYGTAAYGTRAYGGYLQKKFIGGVIPYFDVLHHGEDVESWVIPSTTPHVEAAVRVIQINPEVSVTVTRPSSGSTVTVITHNAEVTLDPEVTDG